MLVPGYSDWLIVSPIGGNINGLNTKTMLIAEYTGDVGGDSEVRNLFFLTGMSFIATAMGS